MTHRDQLNEMQRELYQFQMQLSELSEQLMDLGSRARQLYIENDRELDKTNAGDKGIKNK